MLPWLRDFHANPHSVHKRGQLAAAAVEKARAQVAGLIGADVEDVFFTSGATESSNLILQGLLARPKAALIASSVEHKCVLEIGHALSANGTRFSKVPVDVFGRVSPAAIAESVAQHGANELVVVAVMHANNEIGTVQPITEISASLEGRGVFFHVDASQSCSRIPVDVSALGADTLCVSSHKLYGPAGIGAAYISPYARAQLRPLMFGGGQQSGVRPGTIPVFLAVGFGAACELAGRRLQDDARMMNDCVDAFLGTLRQTDASFTRIGHLTEALPGLVFPVAIQETFSRDYRKVFLRQPGLRAAPVKSVPLMSPAQSGFRRKMRSRSFVSGSVVATPLKTQSMSPMQWCAR
jgi:cysteine desulfurase